MGRWPRKGWIFGFLWWSCLVFIGIYLDFSIPKWGFSWG
jgi:hypothetical protein